MQVSQKARINTKRARPEPQPAAIPQPNQALQPYSFRESGRATSMEKSLNAVAAAECAPEEHAHPCAKASARNPKHPSTATFHHLANLTPAFAQA